MMKAFSFHIETNADGVEIIDPRPVSYTYLTLPTTPYV